MQGGADLAGVDLEVEATSLARMADLEMAGVETAGKLGAAEAWGDVQDGAWGSGSGAPPGRHLGSSPSPASLPGKDASALGGDATSAASLAKPTSVETIDPCLCVELD